MTRRLLIIALCATALPVLAAPAPGLPADHPLSGLEIFRDEYPRAFFFRLAEGLIAKNLLSYEEWERMFLPLSGIMVKAGDEEIRGLAATSGRALARFKAAHPNKLAVVHHNGYARDPRWGTGEFFAGHWLYREGSRVRGDVPAQAGETTIEVEDARPFTDKEVALFQEVNLDLAICGVGKDGKPDWSYAEQLELLEVDVPKHTLRVRRGNLGSAPRRFEAGKAYIAAHVQNGPWTHGADSRALWVLNMSTKCPRDVNGRNGSDLFVEDLARRFLPGGSFASFDGVEFDGIYFRPVGGKLTDTDGDGKADGGLVQGVNEWEMGVHEFVRRLRQRIGAGKLLLTDGLGGTWRPIALFNGFEQEGWPTAHDRYFLEWSYGMNNLRFWQANVSSPKLNYINYGWGEAERLGIPLSAARLAMAATCLTGAVFTYRIPPPNPDGNTPDWTRVWGMRPWIAKDRPQIGVYDELCMGTEGRARWLGRPRAPALQLGLQTPDLLQGRGRLWSEDVVRSLRPDNATFRILDQGQTLEVSGAMEGANLIFRLPNVEVLEGDLLVHLRIKADRRKVNPEINTPRQAWVGWEPAKPGVLPRAEPLPPKRIAAWANDDWFEASFYFRSLGPNTTVNLTIEIEGNEPAYLAGLAAHSHEDAMVRDFEHGIVLANPSRRVYRFDLPTLFPGQKFRRLKGSPGQDPLINNGCAVDGSVFVQPLDALFLVKERASAEQSGGPPAKGAVSRPVCRGANYFDVPGNACCAVRLGLKSPDYSNSRDGFRICLGIPRD